MPTRNSVSDPVCCCGTCARHEAQGIMATLPPVACSTVTTLPDLARKGHTQSLQWRAGLYAVRMT